MRACECFQLCISVWKCVPGAVSVCSQPSISSAMSRRRHGPRANLLNLTAGLLQARHHALVKLNLFGNEILKRMLQMRIPLALEVGQLGQHRVGDDICAPVNVVQLGIIHPALAGQFLAVLSLLYGTLVRGEDVRKAVENAPIWKSGSKN